MCSNWICFKESNQISRCNSWIILSWISIPTSQQMANINWNKLQQVSEGTITTVANLMTQIPYTSGTSIDSSLAAASSLAMTSFGIPLTGSMSAGFTLGFIKR
jgi:hypothetical protein